MNCHCKHTTEYSLILDHLESCPLQVLAAQLDGLYVSAPMFETKPNSMFKKDDDNLWGWNLV